MAKISVLDTLHPQWCAKRKALWETLLPGFFTWVELPAETEKIVHWGQHLNVLLTADEEPVDLWPLFSYLPEDIRRFHFFDVILYEGTRAWPRSQKRSALTDLILKQAPNLNTQSYAYVTGTGALSRLAVFVLAKMGFKKFKLVTGKLGLLEKNLDLFRKSLFGVNFEILKESELTLQPNHGGILVNTVSDSEDLIIDLSYLNFIEAGGLIVDLPTLEKDSSLLEEAKNVRLPYLSGADVQALGEYHLLESLLEKKPELKAKLPSFADYLSQMKPTPEK